MCKGIDTNKTTLIGGRNMPDVATHILCANEALEGIKNKEYKEIIAKRNELFNLGSQGPDIIYYYGSIPGSKKNLDSLANSMHESNATEFFLEGIRFLKKIKDREQYEDLVTYLAGFATHYTLDTIAHPYIYYATGIYDEKDKSTEIYNSYHKKLEVILDAMMFERIRGTKLCKYPLHKTMKLKDRFPMSVENFFYSISEKLYGISIEKEDVSGSYRAIVKSLWMLSDPWGIKKPVARYLDKKMKKIYTYSDLLYPITVDESMDYLNLKHREWQNPCEKEKITESFVDLYDRAVVEATTRLNAFIEILGQEEIDEEKIKAIFPNLSYSSGEPCDSHKEMRYFECIFEK